MLPTIFDVCTPREDVANGRITDSELAADLSIVIRGKASPEYQDPKRFFNNTYPTRGLKTLLENVAFRLNRDPRQQASIFRLDTNYGGGKTHSLIALYHMAKGMRGVANASEFIDLALIPQTDICVVAFDGENADPINGRRMDDNDDIRPKTPWGELAYALTGIKGYNLIRESDKEGISPGAATFRDLIKDTNRPVLILLDELSIYLRKQKNPKNAGKQLTAFLTSIFKAVEECPNAALVFTLALDKDKIAKDAYCEENQFISEAIDIAFNELKSVTSRKATLLDPTEEDETVKILQRRLFSHIDETKAKQIIDEYNKLWNSKSSYWPEYNLYDLQKTFLDGFPLHPDLIATLKNKTSTLGNFQRVRGMLRLLIRSVARLWDIRPKDTYAIHLWHIDLRVGSIRQEFTTKLDQGIFNPALSADIAASEKDSPSLAERLNSQKFAGLPPYVSAVAHTIFLNSIAFNDKLKGLSHNELFFSLISPNMELDIIDRALSLFKHDSCYLDDTPGKPIRILAEANLNQIIKQEKSCIDPNDVRERLHTAIIDLFEGKGKNKVLELSDFPSSPSDIPDDASPKPPYLAVLGYEAANIENEGDIKIPDLISRIWQYKGDGESIRLRRNNIIFLVASLNKIEDMKEAMITRIALEILTRDDKLSSLQQYQQAKLKELKEKSAQQVANNIQQAYRHIFYPSRDKLDGANVNLAHITIGLSYASQEPGNGQKQVVETLNDLKIITDNIKLSPQNLIKRTSLYYRGVMNISELRDEYRQNVGLPILVGDISFIESINEGIRSDSEQNRLVYIDGKFIISKNSPLSDKVREIKQNAYIITVKIEEDLLKYITEENGCTYLYKINKKFNNLDNNIAELIKECVVCNKIVCRYNDDILAYNKNDNESIINQSNLEVMTSEYAKKCGIWPKNIIHFTKIYDFINEKERLSLDELKERFGKDFDITNYSYDIKNNIHNENVVYKSNEGVWAYKKNDNGEWVYNKDENKDLIFDFSAEIMTHKRALNDGVIVKVKKTEITKITHKGTMKEVLTRLFEDIHINNINSISSLQFNLDNFNDASLLIKLSSAKIKDSYQKVYISGGYELKEQSTCSFIFDGISKEFESLREYLNRQKYLMVKNSFNITFTIQFTENFAVEDKSIQNLNNIFTSTGLAPAFVELQAVCQ